MTICYFRPSAFYQLFQIPIRLLNDDVISLEEILGEDANLLKDHLANTINLHDKKELLDRFFVNLLFKRKRPDLYAIASIERVILQSAGNIRLDALLRETNLSVRTIERLFWEHIGMSPKQFCKVIRFNHAFLLRKNNPEISWHEIVYHCGYYDQSHYIGEFRSPIWGFLPNGLMKTMLVFRRYTSVIILTASSIEFELYLSFFSYTFKFLFYNFMLAGRYQCKMSAYKHDYIIK